MIGLEMSAGEMQPGVISCVATSPGKAFGADLPLPLPKPPSLPPFAVKSWDSPGTKFKILKRNPI